MDYATRESKYVNNVIEARQQNEDDIAYLIRIQILYKINVWVYTACAEGKVEMFRKNVRVLAWKMLG